MSKINTRWVQLIGILVAFLLITYRVDSNNLNIEDKGIEVQSKDEVYDSNKINYSTQLGEVIATIEIPRLNIKEEVYYGHDYLDYHNLILDEDYNLPGEGKKVVIAGHKENISEYLQQIEEKDEIILTTNTGAHSYEVSDIEVVDKKDTEILEKSSNEEQLLIYTCYPFEWWNLNKQRYILKSIKF